jgi:uroporphyrinogen-III decarboxylase
MSGAKGNIDLQLIVDGPEEAIRAEVRRVKGETAGWRHIIGASDDVLHGTPLANLQAFVDEARRSRIPDVRLLTSEGVEELLPPQEVL